MKVSIHCDFGFYSVVLEDRFGHERRVEPEPNTFEQALLMAQAEVKSRVRIPLIVEEF